MGSGNRFLQALPVTQLRPLHQINHHAAANSKAPGLQVKGPSLGTFGIPSEIFRDHQSLLAADYFHQTFSQSVQHWSPTFQTSASEGRAACHSCGDSPKRRWFVGLGHTGISTEVFGISRTLESHCLKLSYLYSVVKICDSVCFVKIYLFHCPFV